MTIRFITAWNGHSADQIVSGLGTSEEARMISLGFAVADLDGPGNGSLPITATTDPLTGVIEKVTSGSSAFNLKRDTSIDGRIKRREYLTANPSLSWVSGGQGSYTVTPITHPTLGAGYKLATGTGATDMAWVDLIDANGLFFASSTDSITLISSDGVGPHALTAICIDVLADGSTPARGSFVNTTYTGPCYTNTALDANAYSSPGWLAATGGLIKNLRLRLYNNNTATAAEVFVYGVQLNRVAKKGTVIMEFDDAFLSQYTQAFKYMKSKGIVGSIAVIKRAVGQLAGAIDAYDYCTEAQLKSMHEAGWSMVTHGYYPHRTNLATEAAILADVTDNFNYVSSTFDAEGAKHYVLPAGQQSPFSIPVFEKLGIVSSRNTSPFMVSTIPTQAPYCIPSVQISAFVGLANLKNFYDRAKNSGMTVRFHGHRLVTTPTDTSNEISIADFQAFIDYMAADIQAGRVWNPNVVDWFNS